MRACVAVICWTTFIGSGLWVNAIPALGIDFLSPRDAEAGFQLPRVVSFRDGLLSLFSSVQDIPDEDPAATDTVSGGDEGGMEVLGDAHAAFGDEEGGQEIGVTDVMPIFALFSHRLSPAKVVLEQRQDSSGADDNNDDEKDDEDEKKELYLCSNPNFDTTCGGGCMCASVSVTTAPLTYGGKPPCGMCFLFASENNDAGNTSRNAIGMIPVLSTNERHAAALPYELRPGNPQGVSSARAYSGWNCTLFAYVFVSPYQRPSDNRCMG
ncbi:uncharacterized protein B0I36DRAFT_430765 [Microdochium trichocladiopsis]|uniref:Uncharacterized protein n=1 Tax=Microdochium trichocladiopsis TaxID=1682393 RepID=A0A9P8YAB0_9PEZI|nr:uncharacterized protein B0I36DRAFT_430765 [Microdochium trichocladiopsis]KAH7033576.1 hypothetical protein B0I36DRAFT_430765 [Microdochium trichocladiopsis]